MGQTMILLPLHYIKQRGRLVLPMSHICNMNGGRQHRCFYHFISKILFKNNKITHSVLSKREKAMFRADRKIVACGTNRSRIIHHAKNRQLSSAKCQQKIRDEK